MKEDFTYTEVGRSILELLERHRNRLDIRMSLLLETDTRLEEHNAHIVLSVHPH